MERQHPGGKGKKLTGAVDYWFNGGGASDDQLMDDAKMLGIAVIEEEKPEHYAIWPENLPAADLFLRCCTQWRTGEPSAVSPAGVAGLDYNVLLSLGRLYLPPDVEMRDVIEDVQLMERRALELIYKAAQRKS